MNEEIKNNGFIPIPNYIVEKLTYYSLSTDETKIVNCIYRKTYGYNKEKDVISLSQFAKSTKISKQNICRAIKNLEAKNVIIVDREESKNIHNYSVNIDVNGWIEKQKGGTK